MNRTYHLPIDAIVETLKETIHLHTVQASIPFLPGVSKEACSLELVLGQGSLHSALLITRAGQSIPLEPHAMATLKILGIIEWSIVPSSQAHPPSGYAPGRADLPMIPTLVRADAVTQGSLPIRHRQVLNLINGTRTTTTIGYLLNLQYEDVQRILHDLFSMQLIATKE